MTTQRSSRPVWRELLDIAWQQPFWAVPFAIFFGTIYGANWATYKGAYLASLVFAFTIRVGLVGVERVVLPRLQRRVPGKRGLPIPVEIAVYTGASLLLSFLAAFILGQTIMPGMLGSLRSVAINGMFALLFSVLIGGIAYAFHFYRESVAHARAVESMRAELAQAELRALRAQINPHFLFNTLNSIASLIPSNPVAAEEMTTRLAEIFRYALRASERELAPLGEELSFLRSLLDIERARFGDRLRVIEEIAQGLETTPVPSLLLQPLVENAVRYAVAPRPQGATIRLSAQRDGDVLVLTVSDDGPGMADAADPSGNGFGLHAVRERLRAGGFPDALTIDSSPGRGTRVEIRLPFATPTTNQGDPS
jgi:signal transduction histidine kinase